MTTLRSTKFEERLLPMLRDAVGEPVAAARRRPSRRHLMLVAAALGALLVAGLLGGGVALGRRDAVQIDGVDALRDPRGVETILREAGIDASIVAVPVEATEDHYMQGRWWWLTFDGPAPLSDVEHARLMAQVGHGLSALPPDDADHGEGIQHFRTLELPKDIEGHLTLYVASEAPHGSFTVNGYDMINELSPIGAFRCLGLDPDDPVSLGRELSASGYQVLWIYEPADDQASGPEHGEVAQPPDGTVATWAWLRSPNIVDVRLMDASDPAAVDRYRRVEGTFLPGEEPPFEVACP